MPTLPPWVFAVARFYVNVLHGKIFAFMLMYLLCEDLHTGAPPFIKKGLFKALGFSMGKEGLKQIYIYYICVCFFNIGARSEQITWNKTE